MMRIKNITVCLVMGIMIFAGFLLCILMPRDSYSNSERRELEKFPTLNTDTLISGDFMSDFEGYATDNFPFRDAFRSVKAYFSYYLLGQKDNNGIYVNDDSIASMDYPYNSDSVERAASRFNYIYQNYLQSSNVFLSVIPDKNVFMADKAGVLSFDSSVLVEDIKEGMPYAQYIDIFPTLDIGDYYKTDSHWKQECISDTADVLANSLGVTLSDDRTVHTSDKPFYGVYYGQAALKLKPDNISYVTSPIIDNMRAFDGQNSKSIPIYDTDKLTDRDPYELFLSGPLSLVTIDNPECTNGKHLIMFRDSFGSAVAPLLAEGYSKVTLIDIRYINIDYVSTMVDFEGADVLFLYSTAVLNNSETIK